MAHTLAAGSASITEEIFNTVKKIVWSWTSGTGETVVADCTTTTFYTGDVLFFVTVPGAGGAAPSDNYDVTILDKDDVDILADAGMNRDTASTESVLAASLGTVCNSQLELNIAGAGSANTGVVYLYIR